MCFYFGAVSSLRPLTFRSGLPLPPPTECDDQIIHKTRGPDETKRVSIEVGRKELLPD